MYRDIILKLAFSKTPRLGPKSGRLILETLGLESFFEADRTAIEAIEGITPLMVDSIVNGRQTALEAAEIEYEHLDKHGIEVLFFTDDDFPLNLRPFESAPILLYKKGPANLSFPRIVGIVGTRKPSAQGIQFTTQLVEDLKAYDVQTISGLAYGIDACCHSVSVEQNIPTIGVLGHGFHMIYPATHRKLALDMIENGGALLTEFPFFENPKGEHFPSRNRIVAAMAHAMVVVESARKGGSMITATFANQYNKDVFAVPGRHNDKRSEGCNHLIKSHQANLLTGAEDIGYIMRWHARQLHAGNQLNLFDDLEDAEKKLVACLRETQDLSVDQLSYRMGQNSSEISMIALQLEFKGLIKAIPGNRYMLC